MADGCYIENRFSKNSAADCPMSVKLCAGKQFFHRIWALSPIPAFHRTYFLFFYAVWASAIWVFVSSLIHLLFSF